MAFPKTCFIVVISCFLVLLHTVSGEVCKDTDMKCPTYPKSHCTSTRHSWRMRVGCRKYCSFCSSEPECGKVKVPLSRVVGGTKAQAGAWPWQAALWVWGSFQCGGSLINNKWIATAAHCIENKTEIELQVTLGGHDTSVDVNNLRLEVARLIPHPKYKGAVGLYNYDFALIELKRPVKFNNRIQPVCLPKHEEKPALDDTCFITGWGKLGGNRKYPNILQQARLEIQTQTACQNLNGKKYVPVTKHMICATNPWSSHPQGSCHGDSGGPFVCLQKNGSWKLHGAVSWGPPDCNPKNGYTVFARVGMFKKWIDQVISS